MNSDVILNHDNFRLAWRRIRNSPNTTTKDRLGLKIFCQSLDVHIEALIRDLVSGQYVPQIPSKLYLPKKSGRLRPFTLLHMRDRLLYQALGNILIFNTYEYLSSDADVRVFSPVLAGVDKDYIFYPSLKKGDDFEGQFLKFTKKEAELIASGEFHWVVQADIASFYPSIDHSLLINKLLTNRWLDEELCLLIQTCLRTWSSDDVHLQVNKGLPIGYETSDLLANLFLNTRETLKQQEYLRYVDDIRVFTSSKAQGVKILNQLDLSLQKQGLMLQESKSAVRELAQLDTEAQLQKLEEQQVLLSSIDLEMNALDELIQEERDAKLRTLLMELLGIRDWDALTIDDDVEVTDETSLFFALYRVREKNILLRNIALELLNSHPHRSYAIVHYLSLFYKDSLVVEKLWSVVDDESKHGQVRANCLRALYKLTDDIERLKNTINNWFREDDLSLCFCTIELAQQYPDSTIDMDLSRLVNEDLDRHLLYSIVSTRFISLDSDNEKKNLIAWCFDQDDYVLKTLGFHFISTNIKFLNSFLTNYSGIVQALINDLKQQISVDDVILNVQKLFNINGFKSGETLRGLLGHLNQTVINMILSRETNRDEYLRNLTTFLIDLSNIYTHITYRQFTSLVVEPDIEEAFNYRTYFKNVC